MRNILKYPMTVREIIDYLGTLQRAVLAEETVGDLRASLLDLAIAIIEAHPELPPAWSLRAPSTVEVVQAFRDRADQIERIARLTTAKMKQDQPEMYYATPWDEIIEAVVQVVVHHPEGFANEALVRDVLQRRLINPAIGYIPYA